MFSHTIINPINFITDADKYIVIPFGHRCTSALACKYANIRKVSLPFDWTIPLYPNKTKMILENNFEDFIPDVKNKIFVNKYDIALAHFNPNIEKGIEEYNRRLERFKSLINIKDKKIYFIYINEDYFYDPYHRSKEFNNKILNELLELKNFLKEKYIGIDFNILFFNFYEYNIKEDSNIIFIQLKTNKVFETAKQSNDEYEKLRNYCGLILSEIFKTNYTPGYKKNDFYG